MNEPPEQEQKQDRPAHVRHAPLAFASIWIIIITCSLTNLLVLRKPVLMYTVIPIVIFTVFAMLRMAAASRGDYDG